MKRHWQVWIGWGIVCWGLSSALLAHTAERVANQVIHARHNHQSIPNISEMGITDLAHAYRVQTAVVKAQQEQDEIAGFKACLTTHSMQSRFGINRMVFGVLFKSGDISRSPTLFMKPPHHLTIETELGFITSKPIYKTVHSIEELKSAIGAVVPVLEVPDVGFEQSPFNAIDLVGGNGAAYCYLINRDVNWLHRPLNTIAVSLFHNGLIVNQGQGQDALGDQWEALRWLVNQVLAQGWTIKANQLLITGALGEAIDAEPGCYTARFDEGNELSLTITTGM